MNGISRWNEMQKYKRCYECFFLEDPATPKKWTRWPGEKLAKILPAGVGIDLEIAHKFF